MSNQFFKAITGLAPGHWFDRKTKTTIWKPFADQQRVDAVCAGINNAVNGFRDYLLTSQAQDRVVILEFTTRELIDAYYDVKQSMKRFKDPDPEKVKGRRSLLVINEAMTVLVQCAMFELKLRYSEDFITSLKNRGETVFTEIVADFEEDLKMLQPASDQAKKSANNKALPDELNTPEAKALFQKAIEAGLVEQNKNGTYQWKSTKLLLAYFSEKASNKLGLGKSRNGTPTVNWKLFESIFNEKNIKSAKNDYMRLNLSFFPPGSADIDKLFL